jgi:hypothetical protein
MGIWLVVAGEGARDAQGLVERGKHPCPAGLFFRFWAMAKKSVKEVIVQFSFQANLGANIPIVFAAIGILVGVLIMTVHSYHSNVPYHGLTLANKRELVLRMLQNRAAILQDSMRHGKSKTLQDLNNIKKEITAFSSANKDTALKCYLPYLSVDRDTFLIALENARSTVSVAVTDPFADTLTIHPDTLKIEREISSNLVQFVQRYPSMGFMFFLSIAQMALWFMLFCLVVGSAVRTNGILEEYGFFYGIRYALYVIPIPALVTVIFAWLLSNKMINPYTLAGHYFLDGLRNRMMWYSLPGYLLTVICFGVYLFLANKLEMLNDFALDRKLSFATNIRLQQDYKTLRTSFDFAFLCTTIILSVYVLWLGSIFNAVNSLEPALFYRLLSGKPLLDGSFVYLVGLMYSLLLLIFYVPVRLQFNSLEVTRDQKALDATEGPKKVIKTFWDGLSAVLITASPFLTTLFQKLIMGFLGN